MFLKCPECSTKFVVQASQIGKGRTVRCGLCRYEWFQTMEALSGNGIPLIHNHSEPVKPIPRGSNVPAIVHRSSFLNHACKVASVLLAGLIIVCTLVVLSEPIIQHFPKTAKLYGSFGIYSTKDVSLEDITVELREIDSLPQLHIRGKVVNNASETRIIPARYLKVYTQTDNHFVALHTTPSPVIPFKPGQSVEFFDTVSNIPKTNLRVTLDIGNPVDITFR